MYNAAKFVCGRTLSAQGLSPQSLRTEGLHGTPKTGAPKGSLIPGTQELRPLMAVFLAVVMVELQLQAICADAIPEVMAVLYIISTHITDACVQ